MASPPTGVAVLSVTGFHGNDDPLAASRLAVVQRTCEIARECGAKPVVVFSVEQQSNDFYGEDGDRRYFVEADVMTDGLVKLSQPHATEKMHMPDEVKQQLGDLQASTPVYLGAIEGAAMNKVLTSDDVSLIIWTGAFSDKQLYQPGMHIHVFNAAAEEGLSGKAIRRADAVVLCSQDSEKSTQDAAQKKREHILGFAPKELVEMNLGPAGTAQALHVLKLWISNVLKEQAGCSKPTHA